MRNTHHTHTQAAKKKGEQNWCRDSREGQRGWLEVYNQTVVLCAAYMIRTCVFVNKYIFRGSWGLKWRRVFCIGRERESKLAIVLTLEYNRRINTLNVCVYVYDNVLTQTHLGYNIRDDERKKRSRPNRKCATLERRQFAVFFLAFHWIMHKCKSTI